MQFADSDKTIFEGMDDRSPELPRSFKQVTVSPGHEARSSVYIAQQTSIEEYTPGLNPLVNAAAHLLLEMVSLRAGGAGHPGAPIETERSEQDDDPDLEKLRNRLESEIRGFETRAMGYEIDNSHVLAARYLLCSALDESVSTSRIGAGGGWARQALLSTFHNETWGGEKFFQILDRCVQQPARNLYLLELIYLLLSLGFEGRYKLQARGPIELESLREKIYRQIRLLRGEPSPDLCKKLPQGKYKNKIYAYVPLWLLTTLVAICLAVSFAGFSHILDNRAAPLLRQFAIHDSGDKELSK